MREISLEACVAFLLFLLLSAAGSCDRFGTDVPDGGDGRLCVSFVDGPSDMTRAKPDIPDTSEFILNIRSSGGDVIYEGLYGDCPESLTVPGGSYDISAVSCRFDRPSFDSPQFGDRQCVVVPSGGSVGVKLLCSQMNAGVRLQISDDFLTECPDAVLFLKSDAGKLMYSYSEHRTAFFPPGIISLVMSSGGEDTVLMRTELEEKDMLVVKVSVADSYAPERGGITIGLDTARVWKISDCVIGDRVGEDEEYEVMTVAQAMRNVGMEEVWVSGYIVGGDLTSASASFELPFKSKSNILLGPKSSTVERDACLSVQLPDGAVRNALNLVDNPHLLRRKVLLKGDVVEPYFGMPGIKNTIDYQLF